MDVLEFYLMVSTGTDSDPIWYVGPTCLSENFGEAFAFSEEEHARIAEKKWQAKNPGHTTYIMALLGL